MRPIKYLFPLCALLLFPSARAENAKPVGEDHAEADKKALLALKSYVGAWKGAGALKADPVHGAWIEESEWAWDFKGGHAALVFSAPKGRYFSAGRIEPGEKAGAFLFSATLPDGKTLEKFTGELDKEGDLVLTNAAPAAAEGRPARISIGLVAKGKRMVTQYQRKERREAYSTIAEAGLTLKGSGFGKQTDMRECVITGGSGTISVQYKGQTYYVCCGGCRDAFLADPEKELAAFRKRKEEEKASEK